jgi:signal transduction histidine kinase
MARILVVDDEPLNRQLLRACLTGGGHAIVEARDGAEALALAEDVTPDLVLLDVMMPGMDGFECVRELRALFDAEPVPIVLVTALDDRDARMTGLAAGADEFLTKPIDREVLLLRCGNLLRLRARDVELKRRNVELAELQRFQNDMITMLVHDLKSPLTVILAGLDYLVGIAPDDAELREPLLDCQRASTRIARLVGNILELAHAEAGRIELRRVRTPLGPLVEQLIAPRRAALEGRGIHVATDVDATAEIDHDLFVRVLENLLDNAARYTPQGGRIRVWSNELRDSVELRLGNSGPPIPEPSRTLVFEKYTQVSRTRTGGAVGLGLYFCRLVVEAHAGSIWIEELPDLPAVAALRLPAPRAGERR